MDFAVPVDLRVKLKEDEKKDKYLHLVIGALAKVTERLIKGLEGFEIRGRVETIQTSALLGSARILRPGDLRRFAVTQTPVKDHQLKLLLKTRKE